MTSKAFLVPTDVSLDDLQTMINQRQRMYHGKLIALCPAPEPNEQQSLFILGKTGNNAEPKVTLAVVPAPNTPIPSGKTLICTGFVTINKEQVFVDAYTG